MGRRRGWDEAAAGLHVIKTLSRTFTCSRFPTLKLREMLCCVKRCHVAWLIDSDNKNNPTGTCGVKKRQHRLWSPWPKLLLSSGLSS